MATHVLDTLICKLAMNFHLPLSFSFMVFLNEPITKHLHIDPAILVNTWMVAFICLSMQVITHMIKSLPLQRRHLASRTIKQLNHQTFTTF